jgi:multidrug efflux pump subunit AcrA (membrane-fusion protein)
VTGLKADTAYLFRIVATNGSGTAAGIGEVAKTAASACVADEATISSDEQAVERQQATVTTAQENLTETNATIATNDAPVAATIAQDEATVTQDEATLTADQKAVAETTLTAPISGTVTAVNGAVGATVSGTGSSVSRNGSGSSSTSASAASSFTGGTSATSTGSSSSSSSSSAFVTIDSLSKLEIVSGFAEADATKLAVGQPATITFPALTDTEVAGKVVSVANTSTVVSNVVTYDVTVALINPPSEVKEGMTADVSVVDQSRANALQLPTAAITTAGTVSTVELLQNGKTTLTPVTTGLVGNSSTQILSGLHAGQVVVEPTVTITAVTSSSSTTGTGTLGGGLGSGGFGGGGFGGRGGG